jgi:hypothetical protein
MGELFGVAAVVVGDLAFGVDDLAGLVVTDCRMYKHWEPPDFKRETTCKKRSVILIII